MDRAADHHRRALALHRRAGTRIGEAAALNGLGRALFATGALADSLDHHTAALRLATESGNRLEQAGAHAGLAGADPGAAPAHAEHARRIYALLGITRPAT